MNVTIARCLRGVLLTIALFAALWVAGAGEADMEEKLFQEAILLYETNNFRQASEVLQQLIALAPNNSEYYRWLGKSFGRTAQQQGWIMAMRYAIKARRSFETAVALDGSNALAIRDLLEFYVKAPAIIGGGMDKAKPLAKRLLALDPNFSEEVKELMSKEN
tara:strand:+ start:28 stop:513 length:486 start_codon:yes stop_codon:yes gene_type:complete